MSFACSIPLTMKWNEVSTSDRSADSSMRSVTFSYPMLSERRYCRNEVTPPAAALCVSVMMFSL